jgi:hypothetical protein
MFGWGVIELPVYLSLSRTLVFLLLRVAALLCLQCDSERDLQSAKAKLRDQVGLANNLQHTSCSTVVLQPAKMDAATYDVTERQSILLL